jgi:hypothetical protein
MYDTSPESFVSFPVMISAFVFLLHYALMVSCAFGATKGTAFWGVRLVVPPVLLWRPAGHSVLRRSACGTASPTMEACRAQRRGRSSSPGKEKSFLHVVPTGSGAHPASYPKTIGGYISGDKATGDHHTPPTSAEVKNAWIYTSTPPYAFMAYLIYCVCTCPERVSPQLN